MHLGLPDVFAMVLYAAILTGTAQLSAAKAGRRRGFRGTSGKKGIGWWAFGISLLVAAHSAEQILGMSGAAYAFGIAVATYEWTATIAILVVGKYMLPVLHANHLNSVPEFLNRRYGPLIRLLMGVIYLLLVTFVRLPVILWLSAIAVHCITGLGYFPSLLIIGLFAGNYALYVGLKQDAFGNLIHIVMTLLAGCIVVSYSLTLIADNGSMVTGLETLTREMPEHFHMFLSPGDNGYIYAPGIGMLFGGMWVLHFAYWGANQGIFKRTSEDKNLHIAQHGLLITALIKLFFPVLVVLPGIISCYLTPGLTHPDSAIPELMLKLPPGVLGFIFCVLMVSAVFSMGSELSLLSDMLSRDVLNNAYISVSPRGRLVCSRIATKVVLVLAILLTTMLMQNTELAYMYLQDMMGLFAPIVLCLFGMGFLWKDANSAGGYCTLAGTLLFSVLARIFLPSLPFIDRIGIAFLLAIILMVAGSRIFPQKAADTDIVITGIDFHTTRTFNAVSGIIVLTLIGVYAFLW